MILLVDGAAFAVDIKAPTAAQQRPSCRRRYRLELVVGFGQ